MTAQPAPGIDAGAAVGAGALPHDDRATRGGSLATRLLQRRATWVFAFDVVLFVVFTIASRHHVFFSVASIQNLLLGVTTTLLLSLGLAMMLGAGVFDLSLGANVVLSSVVGGLAIHQFRGPGGSYGHPWAAIAVGLLACVACGTAFGVVNGLLIAIGDINSLIATLATLGIGMGTAYLLSDGADVVKMPIELQRSIGRRNVADVPLPALCALAIAVVLWAVVRYTRFGTRTQAIGSSRSAAERAGLRVRGHLVVLTALAGALAGLAGFTDLSRFASTAIAGHANDALAAVAAVVIGGTLLEGGHISILGALWGAALAVILQQGLVIIGVSAFWQLIVVGVVLIVAVLVDRITTRHRSARH